MSALTISVQDARRAVEAIVGESSALSRALDELVSTVREAQRSTDAAAVRAVTETDWERVSDAYGPDYARGWRFGRQLAVEVIEGGRR